MKSPAYQWYPKDIMTSERVALLSLIEEGAFRRALDSCWLQGSIPADPEKLAVVIGKKCTKKIALAIVHLFIPHPNDPTRLINERQEVERKKQKDWKEKSAEAGYKSGEARRNQKGTNLEPTFANGSNQTPTGRLPNGSNQTRTLHLQSSSSSTEESIHAHENLKGSNLFRQPKIPKFEDVHRVFIQHGGTEEMAKKFYESNQATGWYRNNSPIVNFVPMVSGYVSAWKKNNNESDGGLTEQELIIRKMEKAR